MSKINSPGAPIRFPPKVAAPAAPPGGGNAGFSFGSGAAGFGGDSTFQLGGVTMRVPPGGFAAFGQESPATQALWGKFVRGGGGNGGTKRRRKAKAANGTKRRKRRAKSATPKRRRNGGALKKGSPAAKRRMAALRRMRK
jgi:hypothetical protein